MVRLIATVRVAINERFQSPPRKVEHDLRQKLTLEKNASQPFLENYSPSKREVTNTSAEAT
jgi:hypothetical protein